jgi:O-antigen ligase
MTDFGMLKTAGRRMFERFLLAGFLAVLALRCIAGESPSPQTVSISISPTGPLISLIFSAVLLALFVGWLLYSAFTRRFIYRLTLMEVGLVLFAAACLVSTFAASNKRAAVTDSVTLLIPILTAILLVQILDSRARIRLFLFAAVFLGVLAAGLCILHFAWVNQEVIARYENNPNAVLGQLGITPGSFQQMLFEHSLYSKDVRGFFTTGNSAAAFLSLALFSAAALLISGFSDLRTRAIRNLAFILVSICAAVILTALLLTRSKGAILSLALAAIMLLSYVLFAGWLKAHRKPTLALVVLFAVGVTAAVVSYGLAHNRLPGGNSMLVRWQYWRTSVEMYLDHPLTGVGPGNFAQYYTHYKLAGALETVSDPHNFVLTLLTQYGPLGLVGFLAALGGPLLAIIFTPPAPVQQRPSLFPRQHVMSAALFCGIIAVGIHNLVDFAIFEPAIYTLFWTILAVLIALNLRISQPCVLNISPGTGAALILFGLVPAFLFAQFALIPVFRSGLKTARAASDTAARPVLLEQAARVDRLDPRPLSLEGKYYMQVYLDTPAHPPELLHKAADALNASIARDPADFKNYENLADVYARLAFSSATGENTDWLNKALTASQHAAALYPGCARIRLQSGQFAEDLGKNEMAACEYARAMEIEDAYREQYRMMYPGREMFSRLGEENYQLAKQRLDALSR